MVVVYSSDDRPAAEAIQSHHLSSWYLLLLLWPSTMTADAAAAAAAVLIDYSSSLVQLLNPIGDWCAILLKGGSSLSSFDRLLRRTLYSKEILNKMAKTGIGRLDSTRLDQTNDFFPFLFFTFCCVWISWGAKDVYRVRTLHREANNLDFLLLFVKERSVGRSDGRS